VANNDEAPTRRIAEIAAAYLSDVDPEKVAAELYEKFDSLKVAEMRRDLEHNRIEDFPGTMVLQGKPTFATLEGFY